MAPCAKESSAYRSDCMSPWTEATSDPVQPSAEEPAWSFCGRTRLLPGPPLAASAEHHGHALPLACSSVLDPVPPSGFLLPISGPRPLGPRRTPRRACQHAGSFHPAVSVLTSTA